MKVEYWSADLQQWMPSRAEWTREQVAEINGTVGWEMYREAE
ncbi:hypothetical protein SEA_PHILLYPHILLY_91 [Microbacterium phage PhillyPhilly]|nr:hypothetical protein SEA_PHILLYPHILLY_91 [Microbacterium phage PhillyPhilly]